MNARGIREEKLRKAALTGVRDCPGSYALTQWRRFDHPLPRCGRVDTIRVDLPRRHECAIAHGRNPRMNGNFADPVAVNINGLVVEYLGTKGNAAKLSRLVQG